MLAFTGALVQSYGMHFDGKLNGMFYEKGVNPFEVSFQCLELTRGAARIALRAASLRSPHAIDATSR